MRALMVKLPSGARYWTVVDDELVVVPDADAYLRHLRFGRDGAELTTKSYAGAIALFLRWCGRTGRHWHAGVEHLGLFMTWCRGGMSIVRALVWNSGTSRAVAPLATGGTGVRRGRKPKAKSTGCGALGRPGA